MKYKTLIFDFDGTLADSFGLMLHSYNHVAKQTLSPSLSLEQAMQLKHLSAAEAIKYLPAWKIPLIAFLVKRRMRKQIHSLQPIPGIPEVLQELRSKNLRLGILSSNWKASIEEFLRIHQWDYFDFVYSQPGIFGKSKGLEKIVERQGLKKSEVLYVGDEVRDLVACRQLPIDMAAVTWGMNSKEALGKHQPTFLLDKPKELLHSIS